MVNIKKLLWSGNKILSADILPKVVNSLAGDVILRDCQTI